MSRSRRHTPIIGWTTARSEKRDKVAAHRRERRRVRAVLASAPATSRDLPVRAVSEAPISDHRPRDGADLVLPHTRELSNVWDYAKDGRQYLGSHPRGPMLRYLRK